MNTPIPSPLGGPAPLEIPLTRSPLAKVVVQVRFSSVLRIGSYEGILQFQDEIRSQYPLLESMTTQQIQFGAGPGMHNVVPSQFWRFKSADHNHFLSLSLDTLTLESSQYEGRSLFLERWSSALSKLERLFMPGLVLRLGIRYINRLQDKSFAGLTEWVSSNLIGFARDSFREYVTLAISEANMIVEEGAVLLRWGIMPSTATVDPSLLPPVQTPSWILDIDVSSGAQRIFGAETLIAETQALSERSYAIFRYAITDAGLRHFGADL